MNYDVTDWVKSVDPSFGQNDTEMRRSLIFLEDCAHSGAQNGVQIETRGKSPSKKNILPYIIILLILPFSDLFL